MALLRLFHLVFPSVFKVDFDYPNFTGEETESQKG